MKKIKLYSIGNEGNFNYYIFDKKEEVIEELGKTLREIFGIYISSHESYEDKKGKWKERKINFERRRDFHEVIGYKINNKPRVDMFYGSKKIFVTIICSQKERLKFNEELEKVSLMPKPKKLEAKKINRRK